MTSDSSFSTRAFAEAFFTHFEARLERRPDELIVDLPPALADHFGQARLYLVFPAGPGQGRELSPHEDLLVYGSRTFERMLALLRGQGELAWLACPPLVSLTLEGGLRPSLRPPGFRIVEQLAQHREGWYQIFTFRVTYQSDEKEETFETIVLDEAGQALAPSAAAAVIRQVGVAASLAGRPAAIEPAPERAAVLVGERAEQHAAERQQEIRARLEKVLLRLTGFYQRKMADVDTGEPAQDQQARADLEAELDRKMADELERHQLQVRIRPISLALARLRTAQYEVAVARGEEQSQGPERIAEPYEGPPPPAVEALETNTLVWEKYRWQRVEAEDYSLYLGHHWLRGVALLAVDYAGRLLVWRQVGWFG